MHFQKINGVTKKVLASSIIAGLAALSLEGKAQTASQPYQGVVGKTYADSKEWWQPVVKAPASAPNIVWILLDDDGFWAKLLPKRLVCKAYAAREHADYSKPMQTTAYVIAVIVGLLSIQPAANLISSKQIMNTSFDPFELVNTYGAFGSVGQERLNVVFEGTADNDSTNNAHWQPYLYKGLPVLLNRHSPQVAPYQLRLDWQMWFASMSSADDYPWTLHLVYKLLHNDPMATGLFAQNPFANHPPRYIRAILYRYRFAQPGNAQGNWWTREQLAIWLPPLSADDVRLINYLKSEGWVQ